MAMLATPIIGFIVGAGGYMSLAVLKDTYTGKMPGPASAGYFIAAITGATVLGLTVMSRKQGYLAEQKTARVRTMSGKPVSETLRKLKQDKNLSAKDARTRKEIKAENMEVFEAPKTMTKTQAKKKFLAILKPYWLKALKNQRGPKLTHKQHLATLDDPDDDYYGMYEEDWDWWNNHVKTVQSGAYGPAYPSGDTMLRERLPYTYYNFINSIAGIVPDELEEKYSYENGYDTSNIFYELCIVDGEPDEDNFSAADKRKLAALEKRYDKDLITSEQYFDTQEAIFSKYDKQVVHRNAASAAKCRHCGPYIKAMNNTNNWNWKFLEYGDFWIGCKNEKIPVRELKSLTNIILGKAKPQPKPKARAKKTTTKPKAKAAKKTTTRKAKAKPKAKAKTGRKAPTISATRRKIGTRMRGNDGKMWEVKKSGKSQRWMAGAETFDSETENNSSALEKAIEEWVENNQPKTPSASRVKARIFTYSEEGEGKNRFKTRNEIFGSRARQYRFPKEGLVIAVSPIKKTLALARHLVYDLGLIPRKVHYVNWKGYLVIPQQFFSAEGMETFEAPKSKTLSQLKDTLTAKDRKAFENHNWRYWDSPDSIWNEQHTYHQRITDRLKKNGFKKSGMSMETMIKKIPSAWTKFYNKWWAVGKSNFAYFGHPNLIGGNIFNWSDLLDAEIWTKDNQIVMVWQFKHHDHGDASPWLEQTFTLPTKPKAKAAKKTTTRKAPTISATRRKIGTRMRGNDGKMWEVKKSGKSQRWMAGAENQNWGGNPEGQLAQALERARTSPAPPPLEITELPKICQLCGDESPQAFGLYDEDEQLLGEIWACDEGCAQPLADSQNLSFGAEGDYNDFIEGLEAHLTQFGNLDHLDSEYSDGVLSGSFSVDIDEPDKFGDVDFDAEGDIDNFHEEPIMVIGESTNLPDADSWIIYMHDTDDREQDSRFADLFFVRGPGQFIRTSNYQKTAKVIGGYAPFQITQNLSRDGWLASSTTIANYTDEPDARSLSVGDVVCDADTGRCFIVANSGYLPLEPSELFEAPSARHSLNRFKPSTAPKKAGYWRKKGKESVFRRNKSSSSDE